MSLSKEAIEEFKKIWKKEFKEDISDQKAYEEETRLINLFKAVYKVDSRGKSNKGSEN
jgi:hypothetical protein